MRTHRANDSKLESVSDLTMLLEVAEESIRGRVHIVDCTVDDSFHGSKL